MVIGIDSREFGPAPKLAIIAARGALRRKAAMRSYAGRRLTRIGRVGREKLDAGMRLNAPRVTNGVTGGIGHRKVDLRRAIMLDGHGGMYAQGNIAEAIPRTAPADRSV